MNKQKHDDFLKKIIIVMGIFLSIFTIAMVLLFYFTGGMEPSTLIACVFAACMGEYSVCGFIKTSKTKKQSDKKGEDLTEEEKEFEDENILDLENDEDANSVDKED